MSSNDCCLSHSGGVCACFQPVFSLNKIQIKPSIAQVMQTQWFIAQKYNGADPHGDDPNGDDPHDEQHDWQLASKPGQVNW